MSNSLRVVKLHDTPELLTDCALLLNEEWPRSLTSRLHSIQKSCNSLPISLILIDSENRLLGHIRVKKEFANTDSAFIESLVIEKSQRGKGLGKLLMNQTEVMVKQMGFKKITLTTTDQMGFYTRIGFQFTQSQTNCIAFKSKHIESQRQIHIKANDIDNIKTCHSTSSAFLPPLPPPPPPPPPLPLNLIKSQTTVKVLMHKCI